MLIRPLLLQAGIIILIFIPTLTMRTFAEEKRSGTIELLLTSPLTDWEIVLGKFLGAFALYALMLALSALNLIWLFVYGDPEVAPIVTGYVGLLLLGGGFIAIGLFISSLTRNQIVAGLLTYAVLLMLLLVAWVGEGAGPIARRRRVGAVDVPALRGLLEGRHRHPARHLLPERDRVRALPHRPVGRCRPVARVTRSGDAQP